MDMDDAVSSDESESASENNQPPHTPSVSESPSINKKRKRSIWWDHYQDTCIPNVAECIYCHTKIDCETENRTSPLKNHIHSCQQYQENTDKKQKLIHLESTTHISDDDAVKTITIPSLLEFDQEVISKTLAKMLIVDKLPFSFVEREDFCEICKVLNPDFIVPSRSSAKKDCYSLYIEERKKLLDMFQNLSSRVCLTTNTWTSGHNLSYMCLTAHFIDDDWCLHKKIISFCPIVGESGVIIGKTVEKYLSEWGVKNILTVAVDNDSSNDVAIHHLQKVSENRESSVLKGSFLHMRCAAHIINSVVKDTLNDLNVSTKRIRSLVKYVRSSRVRFQIFKSCVEEEKIESKSLVCMDVETQWKSTFLMLENVIKFRKAFSNFLLKDLNCEKELKESECGLISEDDWTNVHSLLPVLKIFSDAISRFSSSRYVTSNSYVNEIFGIGYVIDDFTMHIDMSIKNMALKIKTKYIKHLGDVTKLNQFIFMAVVLDPRRKWQYTEWVVRENFENHNADSFLKNLDNNMRDLFDFYKSSMPKKEKDVEVSPTSSTSDCNMWGHGIVTDIEVVMTKRFETAMGNSELKKTELEKYLGEDREPIDKHFDILKWWKIQECRYPVLAKMARDILAIPISAVASQSALSSVERVFDSFQTSLNPKTVEALVCAQDWLRISHNPVRIDDTILELENMEEEGLKDLSVDQPIIFTDETIGEST